MSIFGFKILSRLIQSTIGDLDRIPKSNEILTMPVEAQKSFQNFWVNFDCTFIDISTLIKSAEWKKNLKLSNPHQLLPPIPSIGLNFLNAIIKPYIGVYAKINNNTIAGAASKRNSRLSFILPGSYFHFSLFYRSFFFLLFIAKVLLS